MVGAILPQSILVDQIVASGYSLSPSNYSTISIKNPTIKTLKHYLDQSLPYTQGIEPGAGAYVKTSPVKFLRNSCIDSYNMSHVLSKVICLNPRYGFTDMLCHLDVLLCKDANIGDSCLFIRDSDVIYTYSSGIIRLNFESDELKYYCLALLKDSYFMHQLDAKTPRGSTIRHAGDRFLECFIPIPPPSSDWIFAALQNMMKNIAYSENWCYKKIVQLVDLIDHELMVNTIPYQYPSIDQISMTGRIDASIYSETVHTLFENIHIYPHGNYSLTDFEFGIKRGPNLAKRDLGRSLQSPIYKKNFNVLIYPSDIGEGGYLLKSSYIGARNQIWFLEVSNILFASEGTVGKTFVICNDDMRFTTNFHGAIIYPTSHNATLERSIFLGQFLNYLRIKGIFDKLSVGGQGGSFALGYWDTIRIPNFPHKIVSDICTLYHKPLALNPFDFDENRIAAAGVFELNEFRSLCKSVVDLICSDIKSYTLKPEDFYREYVNSC